MDVLVIEAPKKIDTIKRILKESSEFDNIKVIATFGQIYDLPKNKLGIDLSSLSETKVLRKPNVANSLKENIQKANHVYLMTDNDTIGEQIARDIIEFSGLNLRKNYSRVRINSLSPDEVIYSIKNSKENKINIKRCEESDARRIVNRIIGFTEDNKIKMASPFGRVSTPLLKIATDDSLPLYQAKMSLIGKNNKIKLNAYLNMKKKGVKNWDEINKIISPYLETNSKVDEKKEISSFPMNYLNCADALYLISKEMEKPIKEAEAFLQDSYEKGLISYYRTPSRSITNKERNRSNKIINLYNALPIQKIEEKDLDLLDEKLKKESYKDPHSCVHPISTEIPLQEDLSNNNSIISETSRASAIIAKFHFIKEMKLYENINKYSFELILNEHDARKLNKLGVFLDDNIITFKTFGIKKSSVMEMFFDESCFLNPKVKREYNASKSKISILQKKMDRELVKKMDSLKIGKPSTIGYHASHISGFFKNNEANGLAKAGIAIAYNEMPLLLDISRASFVENIFEDESIGVKEKVINSLNMLGIDTSNIGVVEQKPKNNNDFNI